MESICSCEPDGLDAGCPLHGLLAQRDRANKAEYELSKLRKQKRPFANGNEVIEQQVKRIHELEDKLSGWFTEREDLRRIVGAVLSKLPETYYADYPIGERVGLLVKHWKKLCIIVQELQVQEQIKEIFRDAG